MRVLVGVVSALCVTTFLTSMRGAHRLEQPPSRLVVAGDADGDGVAAERGDVVGGVAGAAGHDVGRVVLEDQDRRFPRHAGDLAVDELVDEQIAEHRDADAGEVVDERQQTIAGTSGSRHHSCRRIHAVAAIRSSAMTRRLDAAAAATVSLDRP